MSRESGLVSSCGGEHGHGLRSHGLSDGRIRLGGGSLSGAGAADGCSVDAESFAGWNRGRYGRNEVEGAHCTITHVS